MIQIMMIVNKHKKQNYYSIIKLLYFSSISQLYLISLLPIFKFKSDETKFYTVTTSAK